MPLCADDHPPGRPCYNEKPGKLREVCKENSTCASAHTARPAAMLSPGPGDLPQRCLFPKFTCVPKEMSSNACGGLNSGRPQTPSPDYLEYESYLILEKQSSQM